MLVGFASRYSTFFFEIKSVEGARSDSLVSGDRGRDSCRKNNEFKVRDRTREREIASFDESISSRIANTNRCWYADGRVAVKFESSVAVSGFQTRPHAYFVTVRTVVNSGPRVPAEATFSPPFSPDPVEFAAARLRHGFTDNVASYTRTPVHPYTQHRVHTRSNALKRAHTHARLHGAR